MIYTGIKRSVFIAGIFVLLGQGGLRAQSVWREAGFEDFRDGSFLDAGSNLYVSARGRIQIITRWDFNSDGHLDFIIPGGHGHSEKENTYIYLNSGLDLDARNRIEIPGGGSYSGFITDFNKDGWNDMAVFNNRDSHFGRVDTWIYYGGEGGFSSSRRAELPAYSCTGGAAGDYNGDGWTDLAVACQWQAGGDQPYGPKRSLVYWNSPSGFTKEKRMPLDFQGHTAKAVAAGDLDRDGRDDLVALAAEKIHLFLSSRDALKHPEKRLELSVKGSAVAVGDLDGKGWLDLVVAGSGEVVVIYGRKKRFLTGEAVRLKVANPRDLAVADVNGDGLEDIAVANRLGPGGNPITDSYLFFADGGDLNKEEPLRLPTLGASGVSLGDINGDGLPEMVVSNQRVLNQLCINSYVFWNTGGRFYFENRTQLATQGAVQTAIGDVNGDLLPDVAFFQEEGGFRDGPTVSTVYYGDGTRNFTLDRSVDILSHQVFGVGHADLDDDGMMDLVFSRSNYISGLAHEQSGLVIHWGKEDGFSESPTYLTMRAAYGGCRIADINRDGYLDILSGGAVPCSHGESGDGFPIFWGSKNGYSQSNRSTIPFHHVEKLRAPLLMDLNRDGWLDIAGQDEWGKARIWWGDAGDFDESRITDLNLGGPWQLMYIKGADLNGDGWLDLLLPRRGPSQGTEVFSFIYYGSPGGFSDSNRVTIPSYVPYQNTISDLDRDGWLDIFLTSYGGEVSGNRPSLIYWGGPEGFLRKPRVELPTYGSSGSEIMDFDGDGFLDILIANHRRTGSVFEPLPHRHTTESMLYWGGEDGFSPENRLDMISFGPSGLNSRDLGNSYNRGLYEDYVSSPFHMPEGEKPVSIAWDAETPHETEVRFQIRTASESDQLEEAEWQGPDGADTWFTRSGSALKGAEGGWIQYRARLITPNGGTTPYLTGVTIRFQ
jgi:hypothetical protein